MQLFGYQIGKKKEEELPPTVQTFAPPPNEDGALAVTEGGAYGTTIDMEGTVKNEATLITRYRRMAQQPECERAIDDIINEAIVADEHEPPVSIVLDDIESQPERIKEMIRDEFDYILEMLDFNNKAYDIFRNWYVDGRLFYHIMIDAANPRAGIQELRYIDPRKIKKVRVEKRTNIKAEMTTNQFVPKEYREYFVYSARGLIAGNVGVKIAPDTIAYCHSGVLDEKNTLIYSHLQKAMKPMNQLRMLEDATVIYRLARAPERRVFYIDVGNLPKAKAEQYLRDMMVKHKNKLVYDANTGEVRDDRKFMTMLEDYWLPRREGGKSTEITTLPPGQNLGELDDVNYFRKKLYEALNVPISRLETEAQFNLGRSSEITRDELKFSRFINRLRNRFTELFNILLERQLLLKGIITKAEWKEIKGKLYYDFLEDNHFAELKNNEILAGRLQLLGDVDQYAGKYFSVEWIRKNVLMQTEDEIDEIDEQIAAEGELAGEMEGMEDGDGMDADLER